MCALQRSWWVDAVPGIDLSGWNNQINGAAVVEAGAHFGIVKLTEGGSPANDDAKQQLGALQDAGALIGIYHFPGRKTGRLLSVGHFDKPTKELVTLFKQRDKLHIDPPIIALDGERMDSRLTATENARWYLDWLMGAERETSRIPWLYTAAWALDKFFRAVRRPADPGVMRELVRFPLWWSEYNGGRRPPAKSCAPWSRGMIGIHQYRGEKKDPWARWPGVKGVCDLNLMRRDAYLAIATCDEQDEPQSAHEAPVPAEKSNG